MLAFAEDTDIIKDYLTLRELRLTLDKKEEALTKEEEELKEIIQKEEDFKSNFFTSSSFLPIEDNVKEDYLNKIIEERKNDKDKKTEMPGIDALIVYQETTENQQKKVDALLKEIRDIIKSKVRLEIAYTEEYANNTDDSIEEILLKYDGLENFTEESLEELKKEQDKLIEKKEQERKSKEEQKRLEEEAERKETERQEAISNSSSGDYVYPASGYISSYYGNRSDPFTGESVWHTGIDIANSIGTPILAMDSGVIEEAFWNGGYGNMVLINHGNGIKSRYGHLDSYKVSVGDYVEKGQVIGLMGTTGYSTGSHLHFETYRNGERVNPLSFFD